MRNCGSSLMCNWYSRSFHRFNEAKSKTTKSTWSSVNFLICLFVFSLFPFSYLFFSTLKNKMNHINKQRKITIRAHKLFSALVCKGVCTKNHTHSKRRTTAPLWMLVECRGCGKSNDGVSVDACCHHGQQHRHPTLSRQFFALLHGNDPKGLAVQKQEERFLASNYCHRHQDFKEKVVLYTVETVLQWELRGDTWWGLVCWAGFLFSHSCEPFTYEICSFIDSMILFFVKCHVILWYSQYNVKNKSLLNFLAVNHEKIVQMKYRKYVKLTIFSV